jgi:hypothetical protein
MGDRPLLDAPGDPACQPAGPALARLAPFVKGFDDYRPTHYGKPSKLTSWRKAVTIGPEYKVSPEVIKGDQ